MILDVLYTAPLPAGFVSGTVTLKRDEVYIDGAGNKAVPFQQARINADRTLTDVTAGQPLQTIGQGLGDPLGGPLTWVESLRIAGVPDVVNSTHTMPAIYTAPGQLDLHRPNDNAPTIGTPNDAAGVAQQAAREAQETAAAAALLQGMTLWPGGDHTTIPAAAGLYRLTSGSEAGQVWDRKGDGSLTRNAALEAANSAEVTRAALLATLATKYTSTTTANPATPTQAERDAYAAAHPERPWMPGSRRTAAGGVQALRDSAAGWVAEGDRLVSLGEADAAAVRAPTAIASEAALTGKPAGQYHLKDTAELVAWNGAGITASGPMPASALDLAETQDAPGHLAADLLGLRSGEDVSAGLTDVLNTRKRAVELRDGAYRITSGSLVIDERPLTGLRPGDTILQANLQGGAPAIMLNSNPGGNGFLRRASEMLSNIELRGNLDADGIGQVPPVGTAAHAYGVFQQGSHTQVRNLKISGFEIGYFMAGNHTYLNTVEHLHVFACRSGVVIGSPGNIDSGENIVFRGGALHDNFYNLRVPVSYNFVSFIDMSFDYPHIAQIFVEAKQHSLKFRGGHVEQHCTVFKDPARPELGTTPIWLLDGAGGVDAGVIVWDGATLVFFDRPGGVAGDPNSNPTTRRFAERSIDELVSPNVAAVTLVFRNCVDPVFGEPVNLVLTRNHLMPDAPTIQAGGWINNTVLAGVRVHLTLQFADGTTGAKGYEVFASDKSGKDQRAVQSHTIPDGTAGGFKMHASFVLQSSERFKFATAGVTVANVSYEPFA